MTARTGAVISDQTFGETVADAYGVPFALAADGKWYRADASDPLLSLGDVALCIETSVAADGTGSLLKYGYIQRTGWTWILGQPVYFGAAPGTLTQTKPAGNTIRYAGYPAAADALWFAPTDPVLAEYLSLDLPTGTQGDLLYHNGATWVPTEVGALRNWIINGNFAVNQRQAATKAQAAGVYGYDRWKGHANGIEQVIEALPAGEYTLSWSGGGTGYLDGQSGTSPITKAVAGGNTTVVVPADADRVMLNTGAVALPFAPRSYAEELALCQRYYFSIERSNPWAIMNSAILLVLGSPNSFRSIYSLPVPMRTTPTLVAEVLYLNVAGSGAPITASSLDGYVGNMAIVRHSAATGTVVGDTGVVTVNRTGPGRIIFSAEL